MSNQQDLTVFPVAALTIGPAPSIGAVIIRPDFLTHMSQKPEEANPGRNYALTPVQAKHLVEKILSALDVLEKSSTQSSLSQRH